MRSELGDPLRHFQAIQLGDGVMTLIDLPYEQIEDSTFVVQILNGAETTTLAVNADYQLDDLLGKMIMTNPVPYGAQLIVTGDSWGMFSDNDLTQAARDAVIWHCQGRSIPERYLSSQGFINYRPDQIHLNNLPPEEELPLTILSVLNIFWTLANDATTDVDVDTAEGTHISRSARYRQIMDQIGALEARYEDYCGQLNIGKNRIEVLTLRRVSATTGRLVPIYTPREYDDHEYPTRQLPPIDERYPDNSGIPSQIYFGSP